MNPDRVRVLGQLLVEALDGDRPADHGQNVATTLGGSMLDHWYAVAEQQRATIAQMHDELHRTRDERDHWKHVADTHWVTIRADAPLTPTGKALLERTQAELSQAQASARAFQEAAVKERADCEGALRLAIDAAKRGAYPSALEALESVLSFVIAGPGDSPAWRGGK